MIRPFRRVKKFARRTERALLKSLTGQISQAKAGIAIALEIVHGRVGTAEARVAMSEVEHLGDQERYAFIKVLRKSLSTPIDREDMFRLSRSIDDIVDYIRDFVREYDLFQIGPQPAMSPLIEAIDDSIDNLRLAVKTLMENPREIRKAAITAKKNRVRHLYQEALAVALSDEPTTQVTLKTRELLRSLSNVARSLADAADILSDGAIKRSH